MHAAIVQFNIPSIITRLFSAISRFSQIYSELIIIISDKVFFILLSNLCAVNIVNSTQKAAMSVGMLLLLCDEGRKKNLFIIDMRIFPIFHEINSDKKECSSFAIELLQVIYI